MLWFIVVRSHDSPQCRIIGEGWNKWGNWEKENMGIMMNIFHIGFRTLYVYSVNSTSFLILFFRLLLAFWYPVSIFWWAEVNSRRRNSGSLTKFSKVMTWGVGKMLGGLQKIKNKHSGGDYLVYNNKSDQQQQHLPTTRDHCSLCKIKPGRQTA